MQNEIPFPETPNRPNNWFSSDFTKAVFSAVDEGELDRNAAWLLVFIASQEHVLGYRVFPRFHERQLADRLGMGRSTMRECRQRAVNAGWLKVVLRGSRGAEYRVDHPEAYQHMMSPGRSADRSDSGRTAVRNSAQIGPEVVRNKSEIRPSCIPSQESSPPPPIPDEWAGVAESLRQIKMSQATRAIANAVRHGITPQQVRDWIAFYSHPSREGDYQPGVLYARMNNPDARYFPADSDWPKPNPQGSQRRIERERQKRTEADREAEADRQKRLEQDRQRLRQLELQFGEKLAAMPEDEQRMLLPDELLDLWGRKSPAARLESPMIRSALLEAMAKRYGDN